jgi:hypothetical protein
MNTRTIVFTALLLASGSALAQTAQLQTIEVRPMEGATGSVMNFDCNALERPTQEQTQALLAIHDETQVREMRKTLMEAVTDACAAGTPVLVIERGQNGRSLRVTALHE